MWEGGEVFPPPWTRCEVLLIEAIQDSQKEWVAVGVIRCVRVLVRDKVLGRLEDRGVKGPDAGEFLLDVLQ